MLLAVEALHLSKRISAGESATRKNPLPCTSVSESPKGTAPTKLGSTANTHSRSNYSPNRRSAGVKRARQGGKRLIAPYHAQVSRKQKNYAACLPGNPGAPKVRRTRRGKSVPYTNPAHSRREQRLQEHLFTSYVTPVCGSPEGSEPSGALPYGKGGFGWVGNILNEGAINP